VKLRRRQQYFEAAQERSIESTLLHREARYPLAMYVAGVSAECMLRAHHTEGGTFDERHDIVALLKGSALPNLGHDAQVRLQEAVVLINLHWRNTFRFASEASVRAYFREMKLDGRGGDVERGADFLKVRSQELANACFVVIQIGVTKWKP
jgi:hypothetical protein